MSIEPRGFGFLLNAEERNIETVSGDAAMLKHAVDLEKFMNDLVLINIPPGSNENDMPYVQLSVNGTNVVVPRDSRNFAIKRMFVEVLARMKETRYTQREEQGREGRMIVTDERTANVYPFSVIHDPSPVGHAWLAKIRAEAA